jgi:hypothetical protein
MRFQLPKPLHGWRAFVGEVGIIVIGVLIALGAEQVVEAFHWRGEVVQFRKAVDTEMADSLAAYRYRIEQEPCVQRRMGELHQWLDADRAGTAKSPAGDIGRPSLWTFRTSVWKSSSSDIMNHLSLATRETYASLYDQLENVDSELTEESEVWRKLNAFNGQARFSAEDRKQVDELLYRARSVDELVTANYPILTADAAVLGIRPDFGERKKHITPPDPDFCRRLFPGA